jgi:hypothetical protein
MVSGGLYPYQGVHSQLRPGRDTIGGAPRQAVVGGRRAETGPNWACAIWCWIRIGGPNRCRRHARRGDEPLDLSTDTHVVGQRVSRSRPRLQQPSAPGGIEAVAVPGGSRSGVAHLIVGQLFEPSRVCLGWWRCGGCRQMTGSWCSRVVPLGARGAAVNRWSE